jgi:G2/mitotic-specific cyclin-B, other
LERVDAYLRETILKCDEANVKNPQHVAEFSKDIMEHFLATEGMNQPKHKYMELQPYITERMRSILIDWIIEVHHQFKLKVESLFLTVNLIDRYLEKMTVTKDNLQLVGVSAMLIACKYEEIWPPLIKDYIHISDNAYNKEQIMAMETSMLNELDFNINFVSSQNFLERFVQISNTDKITADLAEYMIEIALLDYSSIHIKPSYLAMSALYLAKKIMKSKEPWNKQLAGCTLYTE